MKRNYPQAEARTQTGKRGEDVRSDCYVEIELKQSGGVKIELRSKVAAMYGEAIRKLAQEALDYACIAHAEVLIEDSGALPFTLSARLETAIRRLLKDDKFENTVTSPGVCHPATSKNRLRRTRLYLPGNEPKFFVNAGLHRPDAVILDLEDSVAPGQKDAARSLVRHALRSLDFYGAEIMVRINREENGRQDLCATIPHGAQVILMPKCESAQGVVSVSREIEKLRRKHRLSREIFLVPIIESALGVINAFEIATASDQICALALGLEDYAADLGVPRTATEIESLFAKSAIVNSAKAAGIQALASVYSDLEDTEALRQNAESARALGFEGMGCIHPRQIGIIHEAFAPRPQEIDKAMRIVVTFEHAQLNGAGVIALGAEMIDMPVVKRAQATIAHALHLGQINEDWRTSYEPHAD
ncbi:MAG: aldolase/citrate lyase family protein [bacterium]